MKVSMESRLRWLLAVGAVMFPLVSTGCRKEPSRWDAAQKQSEDKTAQQSSAERAMLPGAAGEGPGSEPPPYDPGKPGQADGAVDWKPKGKSVESDAAASIDMASLASGDPMPGGTFNKFFPKQSGDYDMVAKQEKEGFAQYSLRLGGEEIGQLSVTDLRGNPQAAVKFEQPDMTIAGYPAKKDGSKGTTLLVAERFQVKVRSPGGNLNEGDRVRWLEKFDLDGLAGLSP